MKKVTFTKKIIIIITAFFVGVLALLLVVLVAISSVFNGVNFSVKFGIPKTLKTIWVKAAKTCPELNWEMLGAEEKAASGYNPNIVNYLNFGYGIAAIPQNIYGEFVKPIPPGGQANGDIYDVVDSSYALARVYCSVLRNIPTIQNPKVKIEVAEIPLIELKPTNYKPIVLSSHSLKNEKKFIKMMEARPWSQQGQELLNQIESTYKSWNNG